MLPPQAALIALGSNLGDRLGYLRAAIAALKARGEQVAATSHVYETAPMYVTEQPTFYNACALIHTTRLPHELLALLHTIEEQHGRRRTLDKGPRTLDLDLLSYEDAVIHDPILDLPHSGMVIRHFVLAPLVEVAPEGWLHPTRKLSAQELLDLCPKDPSLRRLDATL